MLWLAYWCGLCIVCGDTDDDIANNCILGLAGMKCSHVDCKIKRRTKRNVAVISVLT